MIGKGADEWDLAKHTYIYQTLQNHVNNPWRYVISDELFSNLQTRKENPFAGSDYRESVFISNYSRLTYEPRQRPERPCVYYNVNNDYKPKRLKESRKEKWADVVIRVIEGTLSFYIYHMRKNGLNVDPVFLDNVATKMALSMYEMKWVCPGRGLFAMGTENTYKIGNAALNNCYGDSTAENLVESLSWGMDMLMCGGGVGLDLLWKGDVFPPDKEKCNEWDIPDSREGWVAAMELVLRAYIPVEGRITNPFVKFKFDKIRKYGAPIRGFGGTASGPEPLKILLKRTEIFLDTFIAYKKFEKDHPEQIGSEAQAQFYLKMFDRMVGKREEGDVDAYAFEDSTFNGKVRKLSEELRSFQKSDQRFYSLRSIWPELYKEYVREGQIVDEWVEIMCGAKEEEEDESNAGFIPDSLKEKVEKWEKSDGKQEDGGCATKTYDEQFFSEISAAQKSKSAQKYIQACVRHIFVRKMTELFGVKEGESSQFLRYDEKIHTGPLYFEGEKEEDVEQCLNRWVKYFYHQKIRQEIYESSIKHYKPYNHERLIIDLFNSDGACVHAGNVRRSAQIILADPEQESFLDMKDWTRYPLRRPFMNFSNNSVRLWSNDDFQDTLPKITERMRNNGEPGILNMMNIRKYGRFTNKEYGEDPAIVINPCGETPLAKKEPCCLSTVVPTNCLGDEFAELETLKQACHDATFYAMVVVAVPHHWYQTNEVMARNRKIGVSCSGIADTFEKFGYVNLVTAFRQMYGEIRKVNEYYAKHFGIPESIRVTVVKPEGTLGIITGSSAGVHFPTIRKGQRDVSYDKNSPVAKVLVAGGYTHLKDSRNPNTVHIKFPLQCIGRSSKEVPIWEKFALAEAAQRHFADNAVSFTGDFNCSTETKDIESVISMSIAKMKSISAFPQFFPPGKKKEGFYETMSDDEYAKVREQFKFLPFEELDDEDYEKLAGKVTPVDWSEIYDPGAVCKFDASKAANSGCVSCVAEDVFE